ncbi:MAG: alpha/beta fold hydrolase [Rhodobacteraceae bacterium]|nr:alpha/beta fold hydrolase [Paracoccaceae bacterium]
MHPFSGHFDFVQTDRPSKALVRLLCIGLCLMLAACGSRPESGALALSTQAAPGARTHNIMIVTTRERDERPDTYFNGERAGTIDYATASISVPPSHEAGAIEWPSTFPGDPEKSFVARAASYTPDRAAMRADLDRRLMELPKGQRSVFLFIHGYNTLFSESLFRFTQFVHDADYKGVPLLFSWASRGQLQDYVYDLNSALVARSALEATLEDLANSKAERIVVLAHSMGNWLMMETARQLTPAQLRRLGPKIDQIVMAAPDIDIDVFKEQLQALKRRTKVSKPFIILVSEDDRALNISSRIAGGKARVGAYENDEELAGLGAVVINLTKLEAKDRINHSKFAEMAKYSPELGLLVEQKGLKQVNSDQARQGDAPVETLATLVANTAQIAITLPVALVTAPITILQGAKAQ